MSTLETPELPAIGFLADFSPDDRALLSSYGTFKRLERGQTIIHEGESQDALYVVLSGALHAKRTDSGREMLMGRIDAGEWFGEVNIFDPADATATVLAVNPTQIWMITRSDLNQFVQNYPATATALMIGLAQVLSRRVRSLAQRLVDEAAFSSLKTAAT